MTSADVNAYLKEATGTQITAKVFCSQGGPLIFGMRMPMASVISRGSVIEGETGCWPGEAPGSLASCPSLIRHCLAMHALVSGKA
ncbi:MAG: hypothetical protein WBX25_33380 [Rhodomicrobium sp.]